MPDRCSRPLDVRGVQVACIDHVVALQQLKVDCADRKRSGSVIDHCDLRHQQALHAAAAVERISAGDIARAEANFLPRLASGDRLQTAQ